MSLKEVTLSTTRLLEGIVFDVDRHEVRLADGTESKRDLVRHAGGVGVLAKTPDDRFLFVRQYRKAVESEVLEIVAGMREPGEPPEQTARRELEEETGHHAETLTELGRFYASPGYTDEEVYLFFAETNAEAGGTKLDADERLLVEHYTREEIETMIEAHDLLDGKTVIAWYRALARGCL